jgi:hypothetical protein
LVQVKQEDVLVVRRQVVRFDQLPQTISTIRVDFFAQIIRIGVVYEEIDRYLLDELYAEYILEKDEIVRREPVAVHVVIGDEFCLVDIDLSLIELHLQILRVIRLVHALLKIQVFPFLFRAAFINGLLVVIDCTVLRVDRIELRRWPHVSTWKFEDVEDFRIIATKSHDQLPL